MMTRRPHLRTILLVVNLLILLLPIGGIGVLHLYENELIWQTESELSAQGALVAATFREELARRRERSMSQLAGNPGYQQSRSAKARRAGTGRSDARTAALCQRQIGYDIGRMGMKDDEIIVIDTLK